MLNAKVLLENLINDLHFIVDKCEELEESCVVYGALPENRKKMLIGIENLYISYNQDYINISSFLTKGQSIETKHKIRNFIKEAFAFEKKTINILCVNCKKELDLINEKLEYIKNKSNTN